MTVLHQSYFLPWLGYFSKLAYADKFIVYDNIDFTKGFYIDRTRYVSGSGEIKWLSLETGQNYKKPSNTVEVSSNVLNKIIKSIEMSYAKADFFKQEWNDLKMIITSNFENNNSLVDLNIGIIKDILLLLNIKVPEMVYSSSIIDTKDKNKRIINLCNATNTKEILIGGGKSLEIHDWNIIEKAGFSLYIQDYYSNHPVYKQIRRQKLEFEKGVSIIDAILNIGRRNTNSILINNEVKPVKYF